MTKQFALWESVYIKLPLNIASSSDEMFKHFLPQLDVMVILKNCSFCNHQSSKVGPVLLIDYLGIILYQQMH